MASEQKGQHSTINSEDALEAGITNFTTSSTLGQTYYGGHATTKDTINGSDGDDTYDGGGGNDFIFGRLGNDWLNGGVGDDTVYGNEDNDTLLGNAGQDYLSGDAGHDSLDGGSGDDYLNGGLGNDTLRGGLGNDDLNGGDGNDLYLYGRGGGKDVILNAEANSTTTDVLRFENIKSTDVVLRREGFDLFVKTKIATDSVRVKDHFDASNGFALDEIRFSDGVTWNTAVIKDKVLIPSAGDDELWLDDNNSAPINANAGNDSVYGGTGSDSIEGGSGNDYILGGGGNDTISGGIGDDYMAGGDLSDTIIGNVGNDYLISGKGNDILLGGSGEDYLLAGEGDDILDGGAGNDLLLGEAGNDTYKFALGSGQDTVNNYGASAGTTDELQLVNVKSTDVTVSQNGADVILQVNNGTDSVKILSAFDSLFALDEITFSDGVTWDNDDLSAALASNSQMATNQSALSNTEFNRVVQDMSAFHSDDGIALSNLNAAEQNQNLMNLVQNGSTAI